LTRERPRARYRSVRGDPLLRPVFFEPNPQIAHSRDTFTASVNPDGSSTIQFGGCDQGVGDRSNKQEGPADRSAGPPDDLNPYLVVAPSAATK